jgi:hypothetical protein
MASRIIVEAEEVIVEDAAVVGSNETTNSLQVVGSRVGEGAEVGTGMTFRHVEGEAVLWRSGHQPGYGQQDYRGGRGGNRGGRGRGGQQRDYYSVLTTLVVLILLAIIVSRLLVAVLGRVLRWVLV